MIILDTVYGKQHKVLKIIYKRYKKDLLITKSELSKITHIPYKEIGLICDELKNSGFISYVGIDFNPELTAKGIDYFSRETTLTFEDVIRSFFFPMLVAFITALLTTLSTLLLKGLL